MSPFDAIRGKVTARQVAESCGLKIGRNGMACCPFHNDRHPSMKIDTRFHCFGCGADGDAIDFLSKYCGLSLKDAAISICNDFGIAYDTGHYVPPARAKPVKTNAQIFKELEDYYYRVLNSYLRLLKRWEKEYEPRDADDEWHPYFCEALKEISHIEYLLDTLMYGDISDRASLIINCGKKVKDIERRFKLINPGNKGNDN